MTDPNIPAKVTSSAQAAAQILAKKLASESNETLKDVAEQLGVIDTGPNPNDQKQQGTSSQQPPSQNELLMKAKDNSVKTRMLQALENEITEIRRKKEVQKRKQEEYDLQKKQEEIAMQSQAQDGLIQSWSKPGRKMGMGQSSKKKNSIQSSLNILFGKNQAEVKNASST